MTKQGLPQFFLRIALAFSMLSAVADRFGIWTENVSWGNWASFEDYTRTLTFFLPKFSSLACRLWPARYLNTAPANYSQSYPHAL